MRAFGQLSADRSPRPSAQSPLILAVATRFLFRASCAIAPNQPMIINSTEKKNNIKTVEKKIIEETIEKERDTHRSRAVPFTSTARPSSPSNLGRPLGRAARRTGYIRDVTTVSKRYNTACGARHRDIILIAVLYFLLLLLLSVVVSPPVTGDPDFAL